MRPKTVKYIRRHEIYYNDNSMCDFLVNININLEKVIAHSNVFGK